MGFIIAGILSFTIFITNIYRLVNGEIIVTTSEELVFTILSTAGVISIIFIAVDEFKLHLQTVKEREIDKKRRWR